MTRAEARGPQLTAHGAAGRDSFCVAALLRSRRGCSCSWRGCERVEEGVPGGAARCADPRCTPCAARAAHRVLPALHTVCCPRPQASPQAHTGAPEGEERRRGDGQVFEWRRRLEVARALSGLTLSAPLAGLTLCSPLAPTFPPAARPIPSSILSLPLLLTGGRR
eukprot:2747592-Rhodomonas_salina.1